MAMKKEAGARIVVKNLSSLKDINGKTGNEAIEYITNSSYK
jgi:hypothetical protein